MALAREQVELQLAEEFPQAESLHEFTRRARRRLELLEERVDECRSPALLELYAAYVTIAFHWLEIFERATDTPDSSTRPNAG